MKRTMSSWRIIVEQKLAELSRFKQFLRGEDRGVLDDLLSQCRLYAAGSEVFTSPLKEMSLLFWMIFAQHKRLTELERHLNRTGFVSFTRVTDGPLATRQESNSRRL
jgi:hypothetical protein